MNSPVSERGHAPLKTGFTRIGIVVKKANVINVGRQLIFVFINVPLNVLWIKTGCLYVQTGVAKLTGPKIVGQSQGVYL